MKKEKNVNFKINLFLQVAYQLLTIIVPLISTPYISSIFSPADIGSYTYAVSIANYFVLFAMLGINVYSSREIPIVKNDAKKLNKKFTSLFLNKLFLSIIALIIYGVMIIFFIGENNIKLYIAVGISILSCSIDLFWLFLGLEKIKLTVTRNAIIKLLSLVLIFIFVKTQDDLIIYALIISLSTFISNIYLWFYIFKTVKFVKVSIKELKYDFKNLFKLFIPAIAVSLFRTMDKILLGSLGTLTDLGYYEQADKIMNVASLLVSAIGTVSVPRFSALNNDIERKNDYFYKYNVLLAFISCAMTFGIASISNFLANIYLGLNFSECNKLIFWLSLCIIFTGIATTYRSAYLIPLQMDKLYLLSTICAAIINVICDIILIPFLGALGAVIGTILAECILMIVQVFSTRKHVSLFPHFKVYFIFCFSGIVMFCIVKYLDLNLNLNLQNFIFEICAGALIYITLSIILIFFFEKKFFNYILGFVKKIFHRKNN